MAKGANSGAMGANIASAVSSIGTLASTAITTIAGVSDQKKRRLFEQNFSLLSNDQQAILERDLRSANSESERLRILGERLTQLNVQRISNIANVYAEQERGKRNQQLILGVGGLIVLSGIVYFIVKSK